MPDFDTTHHARENKLLDRVGQLQRELKEAQDARRDYHIALCIMVDQQGGLVHIEDRERMNYTPSTILMVHEDVARRVLVVQTIHERDALNGPL